MWRDHLDHCVEQATLTAEQRSCNTWPQEVVGCAQLRGQVEFLQSPEVLFKLQKQKIKLIRSFLPFPLFPKARLLTLRSFLTDDCLARSKKIQMMETLQLPKAIYSSAQLSQSLFTFNLWRTKADMVFPYKRRGLLENTGSLISVGCLSCDVQDGSFPADTGVAVLGHIQSCL